MMRLRSAIGMVLAVLMTSSVFAGSDNATDAVKGVINALPSLTEQELAALDSARTEAIRSFPDNLDLQNQEYWKALSKLPPTSRLFKNVPNPTTDQLKSLAKSLVAIAVIIFALKFGFIGIVSLGLGLGVLQGTGKPHLADAPGIVGPAFPYSSLRRPGFDGPAPSMPTQDSGAHERIDAFWHGLSDSMALENLSDVQRRDLMYAGITGRYPEASSDFVTRLGQEAHGLLACTDQKPCRTKERLVAALPLYRDRVVRAGAESFGAIQTYEQVVGRFKSGDQVQDIPLMIFMRTALDLRYPEEAIRALGGPGK